MAQSIRISNSLYDEASTTSSIMNRSLAQQIEHWARLGQSMDKSREIEFEVVNSKLKSQFKKDIRDVSMGILQPSSLSIFNRDIVKQCKVEFPVVDFDRLTDDYA